MFSFILGYALTAYIEMSPPIPSYEKAPVYIGEYHAEPMPRVASGLDYWNSAIALMDATEDERAWLSRVMACESMGNEYAVNFTGSAASGLMQFMPNTYYGNGGTDVWNGHEQLQVALKMYQHGQAYQWACK